MAMLGSRRSTVTAAAFGSSRVHNGFDPRVFDAALADSGYTVDSLNLALFGGSQTEQRALARDFSAHLVRPDGRPSVCMVLLEINAGLNFQATNLFHPRSINLYDPDTVVFAMRFSGESLGTRRRLGRAAIAISAGVLHFANVGMLGEALFDPIADTLSPKRTSEALRGFLNEDPTAAGLAGVRRAFEDRPRQAATQEVLILPGNRQLLADIASVAAVSNLQLMYFVTPSLDDLALAPVYPAVIDGPNGPIPIFNFAQPSRYPQLFDEKLWRDPGHLSTTGATALTRLLAEEVRAWLTQTPNASRCGN